MALLIPNNRYVKLSLDGSYIIYESAERRLLNKEAPTIKTVLAKYSEILQKLFNDKEQMYYNPQYIKEIQKWVDESSNYKKSIHEGNTAVKLPLIKKYIKDVNNTIPRIVAAGQIKVSATTLEGVYEEIKAREIFGKKDEVKDI